MSKMTNNNKNQKLIIITAIITILALLIIAPQLAFIASIAFVRILFGSKEKKDQLLKELSKYFNFNKEKLATNSFNQSDIKNSFGIDEFIDQSYGSKITSIPDNFPGKLFTTNKSKALDKKVKYLQIALNGTLFEAEKIVKSLPQSDKIIIEAGTPLIKTSGIDCIRVIKKASAGAYIVADMKISDNADSEVLMAANAGASGITCLGISTIETIDKFIKACERHKVDSMIDLMNVAEPIMLLKKLTKLPKAVIIHRGVDETEKTKGKMIPYYQINKIKGAYDIIVAIAGGDDSREVQSAIFNGANIVVVWKNFMQADNEMAIMTKKFLKEFK